MHFQLPNCPSIGPLVVCFYYQYFNTPFQSMKLHPEFSSLEPFSSNARLEMRPKFNTVSSQLDINCICVLNSSSLSLSRTNGPVVACFYYQHLYTRFQLPVVLQLNQKVVCLYYQSRDCTSVFLS